MGSINYDQQLHCISTGHIVTKQEGFQNVNGKSLDFKMLHEMAKHSILSGARTQWLIML